MKTTAERSVGSESRNGVHQSEASAFSGWIKSVPPGVPKDEAAEVPVSVNIAMSPSSWFHLAQGASRNGWTLEECIKRLLVDGGPGLSEWSNQGFATEAEGKEGGAR